MELKKLSEQVSVSGQIRIEDLSQLKELGIKSIICNRPDHEDFNQTSYAMIAEAASDLGMAISFQPVISGQLSQNDVLAFGKALQDLDQPIHAYCRTGTRCTFLWSLWEASQGRDRDDIVQQAARAGYDVSKVI